MRKFVAKGIATRAAAGRLVDVAPYDEQAVICHLRSRCFIKHPQGVVLRVPVVALQALDDPVWLWLVSMTKRRSASDVSLYSRMTRPRLMLK